MLHLVAGDRGGEDVVADLVEDGVVHGVDEVAPGGRHQRARDADVLQRTEQALRTRAPVDRLRAQLALHRGQQQRHDLVVVVAAAGRVDERLHGLLERAADKGLLLLRAPGAAELVDHLDLGGVPEVLGLDEQAVHVEQDGRGQDGARAHVALKYFASGWWTIRADVDCSGCSWNSSDSSTPIRDGSRRSTSTACISTSGQAG